ncbi:Cro/CI family transcriptional regulator [Pseudomonas putida TRO1]|uniref:Cro/CI family transcriptional regulator n=1 Tax=Pseudomonas putida TRO1 TaxID=1227924 RepID=A0AAD2WDS5_PSEPU|nr:helix-turn-helix transcriptional regulator [Pseudomonas putida]ENY78522.1 Cro/CI family transcriptional regulator [Pseudomonas putida TRO1]
MQQEIAKSLGQNIREQRVLIGLSQDALALACGIDRSYMGRIERGEVNLTIEKLYRLAGHLKCRPQDLLPDIVTKHIFPNKFWIKRRVGSKLLAILVLFK